MGLITLLSEWIRKRGSAQALRDTLGLVREQNKKEVADLNAQHQVEVAYPKSQIAARDSQIE